MLGLERNFEFCEVYSIKVDSDDNRIINNFKEGLKEIKQIEEGKISSRPVQEFLNEL